MDMATSTTSSPNVMMMSTASASSAIETATSMSVSMGGSGCKLSMLLNWTTIDACFISPSFHVRSSLGFFAACLGSALLVILLEFLRRLQRHYDGYLRSKNALFENGPYEVADEMEEKLLGTSNAEENPVGAMRSWKRISMGIVLEQMARGVIHVAQFSLSYCIMLLFMYSNGYIIISIIFGALVGFAIFTRDTLHSRNNFELDDRAKSCC